jgi:hypothetical protein
MAPFDNPNYTQIPNDLLGDGSEGGMMADMTMAELKIVLALSRLTFGYHRDSVRASLTTLQRMTGLSRQSVIDGATRAENRGLVERKNDGGVTQWSILVTSQASGLVNSLDQTSLENRPVDEPASLDSRPPSSKEKDLKKSKEKEAAPNGATTAKHPAIQMFRSKANRYPPKTLYEEIADTVGERPDDVAFWGQVVYGWIKVGWRPTHYEGMLERFKNRDIPTTSKWKDGTDGTSSNGSDPYGPGHCATGMGGGFTETGEFADE